MRPDTLDHVLAALKWIRENRRDDKGKQRSMRAIAREAGIPETWPDQIKHRHQKTVTAETAKKLADRWGIEVGFVLNGTPPIESAKAADVYPARQRTLSYARSVGEFPAQAIGLVADATLPSGIGDQPGSYWMRLLEFAKEHGSLPSMNEFAPETWIGWGEAVKPILASVKYDELWPAVIGFEKMPTAAKPPQPLTKEIALELIRKFATGYTDEQRRQPPWTDWKVRAVQRHESLAEHHHGTRDSGVAPRAPRVPKR